VTKDSDIDYIKKSLELAKLGLFTSDPNPRVGSLVVKENKIIGEGFHKRSGGAHAEIVALEQAREAAIGATLYVTLEPCCFKGKTNPCTKAIIQSGITKVVCSIEDPNPKVSGKGIEELRQAGIIVELGILANQSKDLNNGFFKRMLSDTPFVRSKLAISLDGKTALNNGVSQWISGDSSRLDVHRWRARSSAIMTGSSTIFADNPSLNARLEDSVEINQPIRVILDSEVSIPDSAKCLSIPGDIIIFSNKKELKNISKKIIDRSQIEIVNGDRHCDINEVLNRLSELEVNEVLVEAGSKLNGILLELGLIDELIIYVSPKIVGSIGASMFALPEAYDLKDRHNFAFTEIKNFDEDIRFTLSRNKDV
jgi:diaminohydroxyphosphoribosylaminopyrimidine deaminase/5-amino-6-(5-phosphoribosylamino)uracil reductase|tara:strand:- start:8204 stop:9304 length:1101 start_codon:yes stop_codon:yes gene_type:complete